MMGRHVESRQRPVPSPEAGLDLDVADPERPRRSAMGDAHGSLNGRRAVDRSNRHSRTRPRRRWQWLGRHSVRVSVDPVGTPRRRAVHVSRSAPLLLFDAALAGDHPKGRGEGGGPFVGGRDAVDLCPCDAGRRRSDTPGAHADSGSGDRVEDCLRTEGRTRGGGERSVAGQGERGYRRLPFWVKRRPPSMRMTVPLRYGFSQIDWHNWPYSSGSPMRFGKGMTGLHAACSSSSGIW